MSLYMHSASLTRPKWPCYSEWPMLEMCSLEMCGLNIDQTHQKCQHTCRKIPGTSFSQKKKTLRARSTTSHRVGGVGYTGVGVAG
jgi:hypothetical protein